MKKCKYCGKKLVTKEQIKYCSIRCSKMEKHPWNYKTKGMYSKEHIEKIRISKTGENNSRWKGDNISKKTIHWWIRHHKPKPLFCERCNKKPPRDVANISGKYKRDINDFEWLCRRCHMNDDGRLINLQKIYKSKLKTGWCPNPEGYYSRFKNGC